MKAIILAAGKGERLKSITTNTPKPMIRYKGKPILQYNIELCEKFGIKNLYINVHHHADQIRSFFGNGEKFKVNIHYSIETGLLGTAGAVCKIANDFWNFQRLNKLAISAVPIPYTAEPFFVIYGDQFSDYNLNLLIANFKQHDCLGVIAFHYREDVQHSGVAEFDKNGRILNFIEKPQPGETASHWVNAGIYYLEPKILQHIPEGFADFGRQIFPDLLKCKLPLYGVCEQKEVKVFDTPDMYRNSFAGEYEA